MLVPGGTIVCRVSPNFLRPSCCPVPGWNGDAPWISMKKFLLSLIALCSPALPLRSKTLPLKTLWLRRLSRGSITRSSLAPICAATASRPRRIPRSRTYPSNSSDERDANSLRDLIDQQLLIQKAADLGISADADLVKRLDDLRKEMKASSMEELQKLAEAPGRQLGGVQAKHQERHSHPEGDRLRESAATSRSPAMKFRSIMTSTSPSLPSPSASASAKS